LSNYTVEELRDLILAEISRVNELTDNSKSGYRSVHEPAVKFHLEQNQEWIKQKYPVYAKYLANGSEINPNAISPILIEVTSSKDADLFRLARYTWSLPYTKGYGRRLRFLVMDESNEKLIGILGLQSPPIDFAIRDRRFNYPADRKVEFINQTMDIFTLGAIPPYNRLLGGKLVGLAAASNEVREAYKRKYSNRITLIDERILPAELVALTTTSAFGRSSLYNRLKYHDRLIAVPIGYTKGFGSFHLATLYPLLREFLKERGIPTQGGFGVGPRIVWQTCRRAFRELSLPSNLLKHGIQREAYLFPLVKNLDEYMAGYHTKPIYYDMPFQEAAAWWKKRWLLARAERVDGWHNWDREVIEKTLII